MQVNTPMYELYTFDLKTTFGEFKFVFMSMHRLESVLIYTSRLYKRIDMILLTHSEVTIEAYWNKFFVHLWLTTLTSSQASLNIACDELHLLEYNRWYSVTLISRGFILGSLLNSIPHKSF